MKLVGERRAIAAAVLVFYAFAYFLVSLQAPAGWERAFGAMGGVYALGFFGLVAGYFWARWYAIGVGLSGLISAAVSMWQMGPEPVLIFVGATHAAIALSLWGNGVASLFDGQEAWRARFHMDENAVHRLGKAVIRIGISLPYVLLYALAPKAAGGSDALIAVTVLGLAGAGTWALLRLRTWGLVALTGAAGVLGVQAAGGLGRVHHLAAAPGAPMAAISALIATVMLAAAISPFVRPMLARLRA
ncbi:MAG: hypothetical protein H6709_23715 [Kofleriaceae bacterium]|nr:hypothetical protein [Myxococcales bacterium]MCB9563872.1 hypothetical protein [Kofleriaceae bacterium]MCB9575094.1 hypothetical protein [Kofleriaceae bacterium]